MKKKESETKPTFFSELGVFLKPYANNYVLSSVISVLSVACNILAYAFVGMIANFLFLPSPKFEDIVIYLVLAIVSKIFSAIFINLSTWIAHKAAYMTLKDIRGAVVNKMLLLPMGYFEVNGSGRLKTLVVDHIESMEKTLAHMIPELTSNLLVPLACTIWMFVIDYRLALIVLAWITLGMSVSFGMMKNYDVKYKTQIEKFKGMNQSVVEFVNGVEVMKIFGRTDDVYQKYKNAVYDHAKFNVGWMKETLGYSALGMAIAPFTLFPVLIAGVCFFVNGTIEANVLFMMILLTFGIFGPLMQAMNYFDQIAGMDTNALEISKVLKAKETKRGTETENLDSSIEFKKVSFSYDGEKDAINDVSFKIESGKMLALVGPSGSGKSTIGKLAAGYWDASSGEILIGGKNLNSYNQETLNKLIAYVDQDTFLFDKTIKDNIRLGCKDATDEEVIEASKKAGCDEFISKLPDGYSTIVGNAGDKLSGGEKQRIAIVRAMLKNSPIMILDEATASTDPENEASIQKALLAACKDKTLVVVAHRLYTIKDADKIAFVNNGKIEKIGTHEELLGFPEYQNLWNKSEGEEND